MIVLDGTTGITTPAATATGLISGATNYTGFKNRIINGNMAIDQRNAGASVTPVNGTSTYTVDRFYSYVNQASKLTIQQNAGSVTPPTGFSSYLGVTSSSAYSILSADQFLVGQKIEGLNTADLGWGTASASTVTLSFWVRSSLTGTFGGSIQNQGQTRSYPYSYTISSANTWEQKTITITGDTSGTWLTTNGAGIIVWFGLGVGSTFSGTAGAWAGAAYQSATGATSVVGTSGATFYITGVQLEKGSTATSFDYRPYGTELALCQRYYAKMSASSSGVYTAFGSGVSISATQVNVYVKYAVSMRTAPTITLNSCAVQSGAGVIIACTLSEAYNGQDSAYVVLATTSMTTGQAAVLVANNNAAAYLDFSGEL